jgi:hypothetical protein
MDKHKSNNSPNKSFSQCINHIIIGFKKHTLLYVSFTLVGLSALLFLPSRSSDTTLYSIFLEDPVIAVIIFISALVMTFLINFFIWKYRKC